ncbi:hypothetical protein [Hoeflea sp.]|uniref:hypothetical protein n=1 Tax=Hoeflea sp. TaxID=1940281 RepID=UPI0032ECDD3D
MKFGDEVLLAFSQFVMPDQIRHPAGERPRAGNSLARRFNSPDVFTRPQKRTLLDPGDDDVASLVWIKSGMTVGAGGTD